MADIMNQQTLRKMTRTLITSLLILSLCSAHSQPIAVPYREEPTLFPIGANGKWGYADENGDIKIELRFSEAGLFHYGLAAVRQDGEYGYINEAGGWQVKPRYDSVEIIRESNLFLVEYEPGKFGYIDLRGRAFFR